MRALRALARLPRPGSTVASATILLSLAGAGEAAADSEVRFLHALPGGPTAELKLSGGGEPRASIPNIGFGKVSDATPAPSGAVTVALAAGGKTVASTKENLADGASYTVVVGKGSGNAPAFKVYRAAKAVPGKALVRAVHAAPELGRVSMSLGGRGWGTVGFGQDTGYKPADPGTYDVSALKPGTKSALLTQAGVNVSAGTAATVYAVGSAGEQTRFVAVADGTAAPTGGPDTGLGGLSDTAGSPWPAALLAALAAGGVGGVLYVRAPRRRARV